METEIKGLSDLKKQLESFPAKLEKNVMRSALRRGAKIIERRAKQLAPVDSGELQESIKVKTSASKKDGKVQAQVVAGSSQAYYAHMIEYGTGAHTIKPKNRKSLFIAGILREVVEHPGIQPHPFMRPALDEEQNSAIREFADYMRKRVAREFKKAAKR